MSMSTGDIIILCCVVVAGVLLCLAPRIIDDVNKNDWTSEL